MGGFVAPLTGHLNVALSNFAKGYRQHRLVSDLIFPRVSAPRETDYYYIWDRADQQLLQKTLRAVGTGAQRVRRSLSTTSYHARSHALAASLADESRANMEQAGLGSFASQQGLATHLQKLILLDKESAAATLATTAANFGSNTVTLAGGDQWSASGSAPAANVETAKEAIELLGVEVTHMILGRKVYAALRNHADLKAAFNYVQKGSIGVPEIAAFFDIPNVEVARAVSVSAADVASRLFTETDVLLFYSDPNPSQEDISFGKTFVWDGAPGTVGGYGVVVGREPDPTAKSDVVGVDFYYDQKITAYEAGYLIKAASA